MVAPEGHEGPVRALCLTPSGLAVSGGADAEVRAWALPGGATSPPAARGILPKGAH